MIWGNHRNKAISLCLDTLSSDHRSTVTLENVDDSHNFDVHLDHRLAPAFARLFRLWVSNVNPEVGHLILLETLCGVWQENYIWVSLAMSQPDDFIPDLYALALLILLVAVTSISAAWWPSFLPG